MTMFQSYDKIKLTTKTWNKWPAILYPSFLMKKDVFWLNYVIYPSDNFTYYIIMIKLYFY